MKLSVTQSKNRLRRYGVPTITGQTVATPEAAQAVAEQIGGPVLLMPLASHPLSAEKSAVVADSPGLAHDLALMLLTNSDDSGQAVDYIHVQADVDLTYDVVVTVSVNRSKRRPIMVVDRYEDGVSLRAETPIHPVWGLHAYQAHALASELDMPHLYWRPFAQVLGRIYQCFVESDCEALAITPLGWDENARQFVVVYASLWVDTDASWRQSFLDDMTSSQSKMQSRNAVGNILIELGGSVGCITNGAGLGLVTLDVLSEIGVPAQVRPAFLLDVGDDLVTALIEHALRDVEQHPTASALLINFFCVDPPSDMVVTDLIRLLAVWRPELPVVVRAGGVESDAAHRLLAQVGGRIYPAESLSRAVELSVALCQGWR